MASVTATINVQINAANAAAQLTALQSKVAAMNKGMLAATAGGVMAQEKAIRRMGTVLSGSGMFTTGIRNVHTELGRMHQEFDRGSTSLQNYRKNARYWGKDHSDINRMAADRVRMLQSQYVALGKEMGGVQRAMQIKPDRMMREFGADAEYAHQRAMLFRRNLQMGSTALVNWGKNTQWAGRQMMVGMGVPIAIAAAGAVKAFNDIEKSSIAFKRVYGDATTSVAEKSQMLVKVQKTVGNEMMKYGIAMSDTLDVSAKAAATGARGADLIAATRETMRLATLGNMDYNKALEATIAMQTAFNINSKDMAKTTDFLNAVENQTILSMEDMALAVPRVAPVIKGLGGNVEELAIMMTALRQGGVSAEQGANALKSGLGSLLNPTGTAIEQFDQMGVNLKKIVETNKGDLIGTIQGLGKALDGLSKYDRQRALESLFGKYQYARMGALLKNINSKAVKETMRLAKAGNAELAKMSEQELGQISDSPMIKLRASIEELKAAAAPLGALFSDIAAKIISFATPIVSFFANNDAAKWGLVATAGFAALAGTLTMVVGVFANFAGSMVKAGMAVKTFFRFITGQRSLAYVTTDGLEASAAANSLATAAERAAGGMMAEAKAAQLLTSQLEALIAAQNGAAATSRRPGPGTGGVPVAPRPGGPSSPGGVIPAPGVSPAVSLSAASAFSSGYDRAHAARPVLIAPGSSEYAAIKSHYTKFYTKDGKLSIPNTDLGNILRDMRKTGSNAMPVTAYNAEAFLMKSDLNRLMDSGRGADARAVYNDAAMLGGRTVAPYFDNLSKAMFSKAADREAFLASPEIRDVASRGTSAYINALAAAAANGGVISGEDYQRITAPALQQMRDELRAMSPQHAAGVDALQRPAFLKSESVSSRTSIARGAAGGITWGKTGGVVEMLDSTNFHNLPITPAQERREQSEKAKAANEKTKAEQAARVADQARVKASQTESAVAQRQAAVLQQRAERLNGTAPKSGIALMEERAAADLQRNRNVPTPTGQTQKRQVAPRQFTGMGLMGAGMLAQTAIMGLEMAGKEVPNAVNFAVNGLMGIGMASMFFPGAMTKVSSGLKAMSSGVTGLVPMLGATGPIGMAVAAVAAVSAGLLLYGKSQVDHLKDQTIKLAKTYSATSEVVEAYADEVGKESRSHREARIAASLATKETISLSESQKAEAKLASESGRVMLQNVKDAFAGGGIQSAITSITGQIGTLMSEGLIGRKGAKNLAVTMGQAIGLNEQQQVQLLGVLDKITGPGIDNPLEVKVKVQKQGFEQSIRDAINGYEQKGWWGKFASSLASTSPTEDAAGAAMAQQGLQTNVSGSGYNQLIAAMRDSGLKTGQAIAAYSREIDKQFKGASMGYNKQDVSSLQSFADGIGVNAPARMGAIRIKAMIAQGDISPEAFDKLFEGTDKDLQRNMLINIGGANTKSEEMISAIMTKGGGEADSLRNWLSTEGVDASKVNAMGNAYEKLGSAASRFNIDFTKTTPKMLESMKPVAKQIENMPISMQKAIQIDPSTINAPKAYAKNLQYVRTAAQVANTSLKGLGLDKKTLNDPKELNKAIKGMKGSKVDLKVRAKLDQKDLKPKGKVEVPTKWKQPDGKIKPPSGKVGVPTKWQQPDGKIKKPDRQTVPVKYGQPQNVIKKPEVAVQKVNREVGVENLPDPNNSKQDVDRHLGLRPELVAPPPVSQTVNRKVVGATGGMFANGGIHKGDGKVRGEGGPTDDKVNARLSNGEFVIRAKSVSKYGTAFLDAVNRGTYEKQAYAKGTPFGKTKTPNAPKDKEGKGRQVAFMNEWRNVMYEADNFVKEFNKMEKIIKHGRGVLGKRFNDMDYEFGRWIMDNYSPRQIKKMFSGKEKGAKQFAKQYRAEQKLAYRDEVRQQNLTVRNAKLKNQLLLERGMFGKDGAGANAVAGMSDDQLQMYSRLKGKKKTAFVDNIIQGARIQEQQTKMTEALSRKKDIAKQYSGATGATLLNVSNNQGMSMAEMQQAADALGVSIDDVAQQIEDGDLPTNFKQLAEKAKLASKAMEVLSMTQADRNAQLISNRQSMMSTYQDVAGARARAGIQGKYGKSQSVLEAEAAVSDAQNAIDQARIDDINEKYSKQLEIFDQISQQQQAIANLERGRLSVANALSTGDIAAAAMAAQQQRSETASFMQSQMRTQLENQQKAQTSALQDQINERMRITRDIQNQIALEIANQNLLVAPMIGDLQSQNDTLMMQPDYITVANQAYEEQNTLLMMNNAELAEYIAKLATAANIPEPNIEASGSGPTATGGSNKNKPNKDKPGKKPKKGKHNAFGGWVPGVGNSDNVPLLATPGEFVMRKAAAARFGPTLQAMNSGSIKDIGGSGGGVNIDNIIFNINGANLNERDIADIAVRKMKSLDSATIRGGRF